MIEEAIEWPLRYLKFDTDISVATCIWVRGTAFGTSRRLAAVRIGVSRSTVKRRARYGFNHIAKCLIRDGVIVR